MIADRSPHRSVSTGAMPRRAAWRWRSVMFAAGAIAALLAVAACDRAPAGPAAAGDAGHEPMPAQTNRIDIPPAVRQNLGITFVPAEPRRVASTLRVPGRFELTPGAIREERTMLPGRVEILVEQYERVEVGTPLFALDSPEWRRLKRERADAVATVSKLEARVGSFGPLLEAHRHHERMLERGIEIRRQRVDQLAGVAEAGGGRAGDLLEARAALADAEAELAEVLEKEAQLDADHAQARAELEAAAQALASLDAWAGSLLGGPVDEEAGGAGAAGWPGVERLTVRADRAGVVHSIELASGGWAEQSTPVMTIVQPERLRFRASALQTDLGGLRDGQRALLVPPTPTRRTGSIDLLATAEATIAIAPSGSADQRTVDLIATPQSATPWARAGVAAHLEVVLDETSGPALAIPLTAIQRDGLVAVYFRRDPQNPDKAIRVEADLGIDDGRWVVVNSGLRRGDEVVLDGSYQLMLASAQSGGATKGGHFHADGTWHADDH